MTWIIIAAIAWVIVGVTMFRINVVRYQAIWPDDSFDGWELFIPFVLTMIGWPIFLTLSCIATFANFIAAWKRGGVK